MLVGQARCRFHRCYEASAAVLLQAPLMLSLASLHWAKLPSRQPLFLAA